MGNAASRLQLGVLFRRQMDVLAPPAPLLDAVLEPGEVRILRLASSNEAAEAVQSGELEVARPGPDGGPAIVLDEVDRPGVAVVLEVEHDAGHGGSVGQVGVWPTPLGLMFSPRMPSILFQVSSGAT